MARILVVDDEPVIRELLHFTLEREFTVDEAATAAEALHLAEAQHYDLALLDVHLAQGASGYTLCAALRGLPDGAAIKIAFVTALGGIIGRRRGLEAGADAYITKPFSPAGLLAEVRRLIAIPEDAPV